MTGLTTAEAAQLQEQYGKNGKRCGGGHDRGRSKRDAPALKYADIGIAMGKRGSEALARTMGISIILLSNILLVQVISSDTEFAYKNFMRQIKDKVMWASILGSIAGLLIMIYTPLNGFLKLAPLTSGQMLLAVGI